MPDSSGRPVPRDGPAGVVVQNGVFSVGIQPGLGTQKRSAGGDDVLNIVKGYDGDQTAKCLHKLRA